MSSRLGVGFLGAGSVVQAIHVPTLARLGDRFRIVTVMDSVAEVAAEVADRAGARAATTVAEVLDDPAVDVVAICSPQEFHAEQVEAACLAGKRAVLCEKPLATSRAEAERIAEVAGRTGVPIVVGTMHAHDPGWTAAAEAWGDLPERVHTVRSEIVLPPNSQFENWSTELIPRPGTTFPDTRDPEVRAAMIRMGVLALAIHDLPLVRSFLGRVDEVDFATFLDPFGYLLSIRGNGRTAEIVGAMHGGRHSRWTLDAWGEDVSLHTEFTPSFVSAGSAVSTLGDGHRRTRFGPFPRNGYEQEWRDLADLVHGAPARYSLDTIIADITFAVELADAAVALVRKESRT